MYGDGSRHADVTNNLISSATSRYTALNKRMNNFSIISQLGPCYFAKSRDMKPFRSIKPILLHFALKHFENTINVYTTLTKKFADTVIPIYRMPFLGVITMNDHHIMFMFPGVVPGLCKFCGTWTTEVIDTHKKRHHYHHQSVLPKGRSSTANSGTNVAFLIGMNRWGSFTLLSAPQSLFSVWTDLKRSEKITGALAWRWGEWI